MKIPRYWARAKSGVDDPVPEMVAYGWSDNSIEEARALAGERLVKLSANVANGGEAWNNEYGYPRNPLREEIIQEFSADDVTNIVTRNSYGALILNTDKVVIVDADIPQEGLVQSIKRLFGGKAENEDAVSDKLKAAASAMNCAMRIYRTRAGFRGIVTDRVCTPDDPFVARLFGVAGADPQYSKLCDVQKSFRARLTPKPWRIDLPKPPPFPREDPAEVAAFDSWLSHYGNAVENYSTCRFVESVGGDQVIPAVNDVLKVHDALSGAHETSRDLA